MIELQHNNISLMACLKKSKWPNLAKVGLGNNLLYDYDLNRVKLAEKCPLVNLMLIRVQVRTCTG